MRCRCGQCRAVIRSVWTGGYRWIRARRDRWWDTRTGTVTCDRTILEEIALHPRGTGQCPKCRDILLANGRATPEQAQLEMVFDR